MFKGSNGEVGACAAHPRTHLWTGGIPGTAGRFLTSLFGSRTLCVQGSAYPSVPVRHLQKLQKQHLLLLGHKRCSCRGINGLYRSTECPRHRPFQPLAQRFSHKCMCRFLGWGAPLSYVQPHVQCLTGGLQWSGCNVRIGLWPRLLPATFIAYTPRWSLPVLSWVHRCVLACFPPRMAWVAAATTLLGQACIPVRGHS